MTQKFDHKNFVLHFDAVFVKSDISKEFHEFLKTEFNQEPWNFLLEVKNLTESKNFIIKTLEIIEKYLLDSSNSEINLSGKSKEKILKHYQSQKNNLEEWMFEDSPELLFEEISRIVKHEMYHDPWKRFLRTKVCEKIIFKYQNDSMICSPQITEKFNYTDEYFEHPFIYKQDFKFSEELMKDSFDWELIGRHDESEMNTYFSKLNYLPGVKLSKNAKALKFECVIPISLQRFVLSYSTFESASKSDPNITRMESLGYYEYETLREKFKEKGIEENLANFQHNLMIGVADVVFSYPLNPRVSYQATTMTYDPETQTLIATGKPFMHDGIRFNEPIQLEVCPKTGSPMKKMKVYPFFDFFFLKYQQIDEEKVLFSQVHIMDSGGWTNNDAIIKMIAKSRGNKFRETLTNLIKEWPEKAKIEEYKEMICKLKENGNYSDGLGKLLYDLKIDEKNEEFRKKRNENLLE